jgi:2,3-bisphosphoglycerate-dependent phosphoglycerate mutase
MATGERTPGLVLIFETHATSLDNEAGLASGWFDVDLSPRGQEQARALGARRRQDPLRAVCCSDLVRARRTAELAFGGCHIPIIPDPRLRECDYGALTRHPVAEIDRRRASCVASPFPGGESYQQVVGRVAEWLAEAAIAFAGDTVLVVGHRATLCAFEHLFNGVPLDDVVTAAWAWQAGWSYRH